MLTHEIISVIFSSWISMLDLIAQALSVEGISFQRIDGSKTFSQRHDALCHFRKDPACNVLLATLGTCAVG
jgi:SNF2 family DNA or RNA helicase